ncbi:MAG: xanthine dehydrogenase family protein molybdopterin-binding subunit [Nitrospirae bacterium]|nr:xanthine dehydrogenase family protein molybdopterin-binding subunit [Nitrospirota bacterium]
MNWIINISRRDFLKTGALIGGGLMLGVFPRYDEASGEAAATTFAPNAFIRIGTDDTVTIIVNKSEMGQGVYTSLPMVVAEELEADWSKIRIEPAPVDPVYNHTIWGLQGTGGSTSTWTTWDQLRKAGAAARVMLIQAAAEIWGVDPLTCKAENGFVIHPETKRQLSYGKLTEKAAQMSVPQDVLLKKPEEYKLIGKPAKRLDTPSKVMGKAVFGIDVKVPDMLTAVVARCPVFGGKLKSFSDKKAKAVAGVKSVVQIPTGVAVVADNFWSAKLGRDVLETVWDEGPLPGFNTKKQRSDYAALAKKPGAAARKEGDAEAALTKAKKQISAEYEVPYLAHAPMEPLNAVIDFREDGCDIWTGTQFQTVDRNSAAEVLGLKPEQVKLHTTFLGGGFGRRANPHSDFVTEAAHVAKTVKEPVRVMWTREDDIMGGYYRPMWYDRIAAGLDENGNLTAWKHTIVGQSIIAGTAFEKMLVKEGVDETSVEGAKDIPYDIPNILVDLHSPKYPITVQWWRSVGHSHTAFVVETFIDEVARTAGKDPYEFRRSLLSKDPRRKVLLELVAQKAGWGSPLPKGRGRGIAVHKSFGSYVAQVAEVSVNKDGEVRVHKVVCAVDCGRTVNPDTIEAQMESGIVFGLSAALFGEITFKKGRVEQNNFHNYKLVRMKHMPVVEVHIMPSEEKSGGVGEPGVPPIAPAVANAIFSVTGRRIRRLPIRAEDVRSV